MHGTCRRPVRCYTGATEFLRANDATTCPCFPYQLDSTTEPHSGLSRTLTRLEGEIRYLAGLLRKRECLRSIGSGRGRSRLVLARVQGVSPFLFTFRLVAFNYASYPVLSMPLGPAWTCSSVVARSSHAQETSPFRVHCTPGMVRFCCRAGPPGPLPCDETPASWRGDFPQCLTLSATLLLPQTSDLPIRKEPTA